MKYFLYSISLIFIFSTCETVVTLDVVEHQPQLVAYSFLGNFRDNEIINVSHSAGIDGTPEIISDAQIQLLENNNPTIDFTFDANTNAYISEGINVVDQVGEEYQLIISHPNFETIRATQILPETPEILSANYEAIDLYDPSKDAHYDKIDISFLDNSNSQDYYHIHGYVRNRCCENDFFAMWSWSDNPLLEKTASSFGLIFNDETFNGENISLTLKVDNSWLDLEVHHVYVRLSKLTRDRYLYLKTKSNYVDAVDNPFAEPVTVHSNFENGLGIFGLESVNMFFIE